MVLFLLVNLKMLHSILWVSSKILMTTFGLTKNPFILISLMNHPVNTFFKCEVINVIKTLIKGLNRRSSCLELYMLRRRMNTG